MLGIAVRRKGLAISGDTMHHLNYAFKLLPPGRRYWMLKAKKKKHYIINILHKAMYKQTSEPYAKSLLNKG